MSIESLNGKSKIQYTLSSEKEYPAARVLVDWINIDLITLVSLDMTAGVGSGARSIVKEILKKTEKLGEFSIHSKFSTVFALFIIWQRVLTSHQKDCQESLSNQPNVTSLETGHRSDLAEIVSFLPNPEILQTLTVTAAGDQGVYFSTSDAASMKLVNLSSIKSLSSLDISLKLGVEHDALFEFLHSMPFLERISISEAPFSIKEITNMQVYILQAKNLLRVCLDYPHEATPSDLTDFFVTVALETDLTEVEMYSEHTMPDLPKQVLDLIAAQNETASKLSFASRFGSLASEEQHALFFDQNKSLNQFEFRTDELDPDVSKVYLVQRDESLWKQVNEEGRELIFGSRILSASNFSQAPRLPVELIAKILMYSVAQSPLWIKKQLDLIIRCLRDRRTIGMIRSDVVEFDKNVLFVKCKRALAKLEGQA